jgi:hypothetical protein
MGRIPFASAILVAFAVLGCRGKSVPDPKHETAPRDAAHGDADRRDASRRDADRRDANRRDAAVTRKRDAQPPSKDADAAPTSFDAANWSPVPDANFYGDRCNVYTARHPDTLPSLKWVAAGDGRETAELVQGNTERVITSGASQRNGAAYGFFWNVRGEADKTVSIGQLVRLRDGKTMAALGRTYGGDVCLDSNERQTALTLFHEAGPNAAAQIAYAIVNDAMDAWTWSSAAPVSAAPKGLVEFDTDTHVFSLGKGTVDVLAPPSGAWQSVEASSSSLYGAGSGELAVWVESNSNRLRAWSPAEGLRTLAESIPKSCAVGAGGGYAVGVATSACLGASTGVKVWALATGTAGARPIISGTLGKDVFLAVPDAVRTNGKYIAIQLSDADPATSQAKGDPYFWVVEISTSRVWRIERTPPLFLTQSAWTLDADYLYWAETRNALDEPLEARRETRVSLTALDIVGTRIGP